MSIETDLIEHADELDELERLQEFRARIYALKGWVNCYGGPINEFMAVLAEFDPEKGSRL